MLISKYAYNLSFNSISWVPIFKFETDFPCTASYAYPKWKLLAILKRKNPLKASSKRYAAPTSKLSFHIIAAVRSNDNGEAFTYLAIKEGLKVKLLLRSMS